MDGAELSEIIAAYNSGSSIKFKDANENNHLNWRAITHNSNNMFVIVCKNKIGRSYNAKDWTFVELKGDWVDIACGNDTFVIVDSSGRSAYSDNGFVWTRNDYQFDSFKSITFGDKFVAVGSNNKVYYSTNGIGWNEIILEGNWNNVTYTNRNYIISGTNCIAYSRTGTAFEVIDTTKVLDYNKTQTETVKEYIGEVDLKGCSFGNGKYIFIAENQIIYSSDLNSFYKNESSVLIGDWSKIDYIGINFIIFSKQELLTTTTGIDEYSKINLITNLNDFDYCNSFYVAVAQDLVWRSEEFESINSWNTFDLLDDWRVITEYDNDVMWDSTSYIYEIVDEPVFLPFSTVSAFLNEYYTRFNEVPPPAHKEPEIWLRNKSSDRRLLITGFTDEKVTMLNVTYTMESLFKNFTFNDGSIIGKLSN